MGNSGACPSRSAAVATASDAQERPRIVERSADKGMASISSRAAVPRTAGGRARVAAWARPSSARPWQSSDPPSSSHGAIARPEVPEASDRGQKRSLEIRQAAPHRRVDGVPAERVRVIQVDHEGACHVVGARPERRVGHAPTRVLLDPVRIGEGLQVLSLRREERSAIRHRQRPSRARDRRPHRPPLRTRSGRPRRLLARASGD